MVEIYDFLLGAPFALVDSLRLLAFAIGQSVETKQISVSSLNDVLLRLITINGAYFREIRGVGNGTCTSFPSPLLLWSLRGNDQVEDSLRPLVEEVDDRLSYFALVNFPA
jgi:hypothetical protein